MDVDIVPIGGRLAARVEGVSLGDLGADAPAELVDLLTDALHQHLVLLFPEQALGDEDLQAFAERFGDLYLHPIARLLGFARARVEHIVDDADHPPYQDGWHTDVSFDHHPPSIGCLQAVQMPARGGETLWADMYAAYESLSPAMQVAIADLRGIHAPGVLPAFATKLGPDLAAAIDQQFPGTEHPVVGIHPATGRRYLAVNAAFTTGIAGMTPAESRPLLDHLFSVVTSPNIQFRHRWSVGDVIVWDERATQHFATSDHDLNRREVARVTVA